MIKSIFAMQEHPDLSIAECQQHWYEVHGQHHVGPTHKLDGYVQTHSLIAAYGGSPSPTHCGISTVWSRDLAHLKEAMVTPAWEAASVDGLTGVYGKPLFRQPIMVAIGEEVVIKDGPVTPFMVKMVTALARPAGVDAAAFHRHWRDVHGPLAARVPGVRRYVQNHTFEAAYAHPRASHDGWAELWFDDLPAMRAAMASPEWAGVSEDVRTGLNGGPMFDRSRTALVIGRDRDMLRGSRA